MNWKRVAAAESKFFRINKKVISEGFQKKQVFEEAVFLWGESVLWIEFHPGIS